MKVTGSPIRVEFLSLIMLVVVNPRRIRCVTWYVFANPGSPVTATSKMQFDFILSSVIARQTFSALFRSRGLTTGASGTAHGRFSLGQLAIVNVAVEVPAA